LLVDGGKEEVLMHGKRVEHGVQWCVELDHGFKATTGMRGLAGRGS